MSICIKQINGQYIVACPLKGAHIKQVQDMMHVVHQRYKLHPPSKEEVITFLQNHPQILHNILGFGEIDTMLRQDIWDAIEEDTK